MHCLAHVAIRMVEKEPEFQIRYIYWSAVGSFLLPVAVMGLALYPFDLSEKFSVLEIVITGFVTALGACGMYYTSETGMLNYTRSYSADYVVAAVLCVVLANVLAFGTFFYLKVTWTSSFVRRLACAAVLAASLSAMQWFSERATKYRFKSSAGRMGSLSRQAEIIVVLVLVGRSLRRPYHT